MFRLRVALVALTLQHLPRPAFLVLPSLKAEAVAVVVVMPQLWQDRLARLAASPAVAVEVALLLTTALPLVLAVMVPPAWS
jgi:hypothetical protein